MKSASHLPIRVAPGLTTASPSCLSTGPAAGQPVCLLPGPVSLSPRVQMALGQPPIYHRATEFVDLFEDVRRRLVALTRGRGAALFVGSGTLANDVVAATLAATSPAGQGLILDNGEFGRRLVRQAARFGLTPRVLTWPWGSGWDLETLAIALAAQPPGSWVWGVHHETSTGVLNDLPSLVRLARRRGVRVCVECVSSLGAVPLDLSEIFLASGTSGKALASYSGIALVFADLQALNRIVTGPVPAYLDLAAALGQVGPAYTFPSPLLCALAAALAEYETAVQTRRRYENYAEVGRYVRRELRRLGAAPLAPDREACPTVTTFAPPDGWASLRFVERCRSFGFLIGGQSAYLGDRNLVQIATMGETSRAVCAPLFEQLERLRGPVL